ncbi:unnamed protein product [Rhodiola kirilowii]
MDACYSSEKVLSSFSSTLLETVYRSIDTEGQLDESMFGAERKKKQISSARDSSCSKREEIEKWMEKRTVSSGFHQNPRRKLPADQAKVFDKKTLSAAMERNSGLASSSHCSDSSNAERGDYPTATSKIPKSKSTNSGYSMPNPIRASTNNEASRSNSGHFVKTKSHALKFYKELKKMKQPISPGRRLATLINSLFLTGVSKKAKFTNENDHLPNGNSKSTCSSASSFSRSCLSHKTSSSSASSTNKAIRSVRFSNSPNLTVFKEQKPVKMDESCDAQTDDIQALLQKYHNADLFAIYGEFEEDNEDVASSCGSSDLFELDHLMMELPVYETTLLDASRPIANSMLA